MFSFSQEEEKAMIRLVFEQSDPFRREETPPARYFRFDHDTLFEGTGDRIVAYHLASGFWRTTERHHISGEFVGKAQICFEDSPGGFLYTLGPYEKVQVVGGSIYGDDKVVARFVGKTRRWISLGDYIDWPVMVVKAA